MNWYKKAQKIRLWLDDDRDPTDPNIQNLFGAVGDELWVKNSAEAISWLETGKVGWISLDNDLGDIKINGEGYDVAKWIEEQAYYGKIERIKCRVHTQNVGKQDQIYQAISNADEYWSEHESQEDSIAETNEEEYLV
jgi:hypothetical protein